MYASSWPIEQLVEYLVRNLTFSTRKSLDGNLSFFLSNMPGVNRRTTLITTPSSDTFFLLGMQILYGLCFRLGGLHRVMKAEKGGVQHHRPNSGTDLEKFQEIV